MLDETTRTQDSSEISQDSSAAGSDTSAENETTFTKESQDKAVQDALSAAGRDNKAFEAKEKQLADDRAAWIKQQRDAELEAVKDDADATAKLKAGHAMADREAAVKAREDATAGKQTEQDKTQLSGSYMIVASKHGIDAAELQTASEELGLTNENQIDLLAQRMKKTPAPLITDSGRTSASGTDKAKTPEQLVTSGLAKLRKQK